jgi:hypothetical protein
MAAHLVGRIQPPPISPMSPEHIETSLIAPPQPFVAELERAA